MSIFDELKIYTVVQITEADFGCEDTGRTEPMALLKLKGISPDAEAEKYVEVSERELSLKGISEWKQVCFTETGEILRYVRVVAAVIRRTRNGEEEIFATARGYGAYKGWWEFPGGKIEQGETPQEALKREIREELTVGIEVLDFIKTIEYDYPEFHLSMDCFWAEVTSGEMVLKEAEAARWLLKGNLDSVNWLPADRGILGLISKNQEKHQQGGLK